MKDPSPSLLTPRERQIVTLLLEGCTNRTIAGAARRLRPDGEEPAFHALSKDQGVGSRLELVLVAMRSELGSSSVNDGGREVRKSSSELSGFKFHIQRSGSAKAIARTPAFSRLTICTFIRLQRYPSVKSPVSGYRTEPMETMKDPSPSSLTARERQIVTLLLEGCTNKPIGARLGIGDQTAMNQLSTLYQKVGAGSRLELVLAVMLRVLR